eukprot:TRINITY_DN6996_c0_g1_i1.p1 TRINITY_DN6996_c0_g1~~TRINITY_DN6996_c0_g1_i1.p1  ORF type:complete len:598 (+),score=174.02 TRINITY_DN6996_c0_g1_i1:158-1951(+)
MMSSLEAHNTGPLSIESARDTADATTVPEPTRREKIYALLDTSMPASSPALQQAATIISISIFVLIAVSIVVFCVESHPDYWQRNNEVLYSIEACCIAVFSFEYGVKLALCPDRVAFLRSPLNGIDVASILPFYMDLFVSKIGGSESHLDSLVFLRVVRLARVFRVFKLGKYSSGLQLVVFAMSQSSEALSLLAFLLGIGLVLFASLVFIAEEIQSSFNETREVWVYANDSALGVWAGADSQFQSIPSSVWWALVTLSTVGYGDQVPRTWAGKAVGFVTMIVGVLVLAFPIILISNNFSETVKEFTEQQRREGAAQSAGDPFADFGAVLSDELDSDVESGPPSPIQETPTAGIARRSPDTSPPPSVTAAAIPSPRSLVAIEPGPNSIVTHFKFGGRMRPVYYVSKLANDVHQFRYDPLFTVPMDRRGDVDAVTQIDEAVGQYLLRVDVVLDHEHVQSIAVEAVARTGLFDRRKVARANTFAFQLAKITLSVPTLPQCARLLTTEFASPGTSLPVLFAATSAESLATIRELLPECFMHLSCTNSFGAGTEARPDFQVTVPLLLSLYSRPNVALWPERAAGVPFSKVSTEQPSFSTEPA